MTDQPRRCPARACGYLVPRPAVWCPKHRYRERKNTMPEEREPGLHDEHDLDDLDALVGKIRDRPRDVVPKKPYTGSNDDVADAIASGAEIRHAELTEDGPRVVTETGWHTVTKPFEPSNEGNQE